MGLGVASKMSGIWYNTCMRFLYLPRRAQRTQRGMRMKDQKEITEIVVDAAIKIHREFVPHTHSLRPLRALLEEERKVEQQW